MTLITTPHLDAPDDFYEALIEAHHGLSTEQSHAMNARLVLLLANHIGALPVLREALAAARATLPADALVPPVAPSGAAPRAPHPSGPTP